MTDNIVDLATERKQRQMLAARAAEGGDALISGLQLAGHTFADLGWLLAAPVRAHDRQLTPAIYQVVLQRLGQIVDDAIADVDYASWNINTTMKQGRDVAFAAFTARMMSLIKARLDEDGWRPTNEHGP